MILRRIAPSLCHVLIMFLVALPLYGGELPYKNGPYSPFPLLQQAAKRLTAKAPFRFIVLGDSKHAREFPKLLETARSLKPDLIIYTGDLVSRGSAEIKDWLDAESEIASTARLIPFVMAEGNHEVAGGAQNVGRDRFIKFFGLEKDYFFFDLGLCRFIILGWEFQEDAAQVAWLEQTLKSGQGRYIFVVAHIPFYTIGHKDKDEVPNKETRFTQMFAKYGVTCVFSGHDHIYYRTDRGGVTYIISGLAGAGVYSLDRLSEGLPGDIFVGEIDDKAVRKDPVSGKHLPVKDPYCLVEVLVQGKQIVCRTVNTAGEEFDRFVPVRVAQPVPAGR